MATALAMRAASRRLPPGWARLALALPLASLNYLHPFWGFHASEERPNFAVFLLPSALSSFKVCVRVRKCAWRASDPTPPFACLGHAIYISNKCSPCMHMGNRIPFAS